MICIGVKSTSHSSAYFLHFLHKNNHFNIFVFPLVEKQREREKERSYTLVHSPGVCNNHV